MLPDISGLDVCRQIRKELNLKGVKTVTRCAVRSIAFSSHQLIGLTVKPVWSVWPVTS